MTRRLSALICLIGLMAGCEDDGVSGVARREMIRVKDLLNLQAQSGAVLVEIHGAPWAGAGRAEIAGTLRMPEGKGRGVRFSGVAPGRGLIGSGERLVLRFNPAAGAKVRDCAATEELPTSAPDGDGFVVAATFCRETDWLVRATLNAGDVSADDWLAYYLRMQDLLGAMFPE